MPNTKSVTVDQKSVTEQRDTSRARTPSFGGDVTVSRVTTKRDVTGRERDSDMTSTGPKGPRSRHHHDAAASHASKPMTWTHIAAMNTLADHKAGVTVDPLKLAAARALLEAA